MKPQFIVVKSIRRSYGYSLKNVGAPQSWIIGPGQTCHWYKFKRDAVEAANRLNASYTK